MVSQYPPANKKRKWTKYREKKEAVQLRKMFLGTGTELYRDISTKCLSLHSADIAQDQRWHWAYLCGKQIQCKKAYPF